MKTSQVGINLIKSFEGLKLEAYKPVETEKYWTIGYGHYGSDVKQGQKITSTQAENMLKKDVAEFEGYVNNLKMSLNQYQFDALVSFAFNLGNGNLVQLVKGRTMTQIANAILLYNKAGGKTLTGLVRRREAERALFVKPVAPAKVQAVYYTVKSGDNLTEIAVKYKTTVANLMKLNTIKNVNLIKIGQRIRIK